MIDILLSTYNGTRYLPDLLQSIIGQTTKEWQLWIRDDGSIDNTLEIIDTFISIDSRIHILHDTDGNVGTLKSFERLLNQSNADYIMFADQDDIWLPDKITHAMEVIQNTEHDKGAIPIVICTDLVVTDERLQILQNSLWRYSNLCPSLLNTPTALATCNFVTGCTMFFNKYAKECSLPFGQYAVMHDYWIALSTLKHKGCIIPLAQADILYRQHDKNVLGAQKELTGWDYITNKWNKRVTIKHTNRKYYQQAHELLQLSLFSFWKAKIIYLWRKRRRK